MTATCTVGGTMGGYCEIGRPKAAKAPAMTMKMDNTEAKMGRSIKKFEITRASPCYQINGSKLDATYFLFGVGGVDPGTAGTAAGAVLAPDLGAVTSGFTSVAALGKAGAGLSEVGMATSSGVTGSPWRTI